MNTQEIDSITFTVWNVIRNCPKTHDEMEKKGAEIFHRYKDNFYFSSDASLTHDVADALADKLKEWFWENAPVCEEECEWWHQTHARVLNEVCLQCDWIWIAEQIVNGIQEGLDD